MTKLRPDTSDAPILLGRLPGWITTGGTTTGGSSPGGTTTGGTIGGTTGGTTTGGTTTGGVTTGGTTGGTTMGGMTGGTTGGTTTPATPVSYNPNDPLWALQWHFRDRGTTDGRTAGGGDVVDFSLSIAPIPVSAPAQGMT